MFNILVMKCLSNVNVSIWRRLNLTKFLKKTVVTYVIKVMWLKDFFAQRKANHFYK